MFVDVGVLEREVEKERERERDRQRERQTQREGWWPDAVKLNKQGWRLALKEAPPITLDMTKKT